MLHSPRSKKFAHTLSNNPIAAAEVAAAIQRTVDRLAKRPKSAPIVHGAKVQAKLVERYQ
jgi:plasmid stabilization system protein ParE